MVFKLEPYKNLALRTIKEYYVFYVHSLFKIVFNLIVAKEVLTTELSSGFALAYGFSPFVSAFSRAIIPRLQYFKSKGDILSVLEYLIPVCLNLIVVTVLIITYSTLNIESIFLLIFVAVSSDFIIEFSTHLRSHLIEKSMVYALISTFILLNVNDSLRWSFIALILHAFSSSIFRLSRNNLILRYRSRDFLHVFNEIIKSLPAMLLSLVSVNLNFSQDFIIISRAKGALDLLSSIELSRINNKLGREKEEIGVQKALFLTLSGLLVCVMLSLYFDYSFLILLMSFVPVLTVYSYLGYIGINILGSYPWLMLSVSLLCMVFGLLPFLIYPSGVGIILFYIIFNASLSVLYHVAKKKYIFT